MVAQAKIEVLCWLPPSDHLRQRESNLAVNPFSVHKAIADSRVQMIQWLSWYNLQTFKCKLQSCLAMLHFASRTLSHIFDIKTQPTVNLTISQTYWLHQTGQLHCYHHILKQSLEQSESYSRNFSHYCYSSIWYQNLQQIWKMRPKKHVVSKPFIKGVLMVFMCQTSFIFLISQPSL